MLKEFDDEMSKAIILKESNKELPTDEEINLYAQSLGICPEKESYLLSIAREGINAPLPKGWQVLQVIMLYIVIVRFCTWVSVFDIKTMFCLFYLFRMKTIKFFTIIV